MHHSRFAPHSGPKMVATGAILALSVILAVGVAAAADPGRVAPTRVAPEPANGGIDAHDYANRQQTLHAWLMSELPDGTLNDPISVRLTSDELRELESKQFAVDGPAVVGQTKAADRAIRLAQGGTRLSKQPTARSYGMLSKTSDGGFVWAAAVNSEGASALRVHFTDVNLPADTDLYFFNKAGQAFGPYTELGPSGDGDFWSHTIDGSEGFVLLRYYGSAPRRALASTSFTIAEIGHIGPAFQDSLNKSFCSFNEPCIENAECENFSGGSAGDLAQRAIALMQWISGPYIYTCTGGLIADTDPGTQVRYFLTAHHCISRGKDAKNMEAHFQYTVSCGTSNCPAQSTQPGSIQVLGASIKNSSTNGDHTLLELNTGDPLPGNAVFLGWNNSPVANSNGTALHRVSHPAWAPQAYSAQSVTTSAGTCTTLPRGEFIYSRDTFGGTEGGSSGSPVWNSAGEIVGQLYGACGTNVNDACDSNSNATVDGALAHYFPDVASFLAPSTASENCTNGADDDGDGAVDCADSDCSGDPACGGGCSLGQPGDSCSSNGDCCSNNCKGPPSNKTCR